MPEASDPQIEEIFILTTPPMTGEWVRKIGEGTHPRPNGGEDGFAVGIGAKHLLRPSLLEQFAVAIAFDSRVDNGN
jgi:hypothetical protein